jgi:hypothetical protein
VILLVRARSQPASPDNFVRNGNDPQLTTLGSESAERYSAAVAFTGTSASTSEAKNSRRATRSVALPTRLTTTVRAKSHAATLQAAEDGTHYRLLKAGCS